MPLTNVNAWVSYGSQKQPVQTCLKPPSIHFPSIFCSGKPISAKMHHCRPVSVGKATTERALTSPENYKNGWDQLHQYYVNFSSSALEVTDVDLKITHLLESVVSTGSKKTVCDLYWNHSKAIFLSCTEYWWPIQAKKQNDVLKGFMMAWQNCKLRNLRSNATSHSLHIA